MVECYDCGDPAEYQDIELPGDFRCAECHLNYLVEQTETWVEELRYHVEVSKLEFNFEDLLP